MEICKNSEGKDVSTLSYIFGFFIYFTLLYHHISQLMAIFRSQEITRVLYCSASFSNCRITKKKNVYKYIYRDLCSFIVF